MYISIHMFWIVKRKQKYISKNTHEKQPKLFSLHYTVCSTNIWTHMSIYYFPATDNMTMFILLNVFCYDSTPLNTVYVCTATVAISSSHFVVLFFPLIIHFQLTIIYTLHVALTPIIITNTKTIQRIYMKKIKQEINLPIIYTSNV